MGQKERQKEPGSRVPSSRAYLGGWALAGDRAASLSLNIGVDLCLSTLQRLQGNRTPESVAGTEKGSPQVPGAILPAGC